MALLHKWLLLLCAITGSLLVKPAYTKKILSIKKSVKLTKKHIGHIIQGSGKVSKKASDDPSPCTTAERLETTTEMTTSYGNDQQSLEDPRGRYEYEDDAWFRLEGEGGTEVLASKPRQVGLCNTRYPGYIRYQSSTTGTSRPGAQTEATLCHLSRSSECDSPTPIMIHQCENYLVYKIPKVNTIVEHADYFCTQLPPCTTAERLQTTTEMTTSYGYSPQSALRDPRRGYRYRDAWFRLEGEGGTEILDSKPLMIYICNARYPGYIRYEGTRPESIPSGLQIQATLCYKGERSDCDSPGTIFISQCENYRVFRISPGIMSNMIPGTPGTDTDAADNFCTQNSGQPPQSSDPCNTRETLLTTTKMTTSFGSSRIDLESDRRRYYEYEVRAWFRLQGDGGTEILSQKPPSTYKCNSDTPGWIKYDGDSPDGKRPGWETEGKICHMFRDDECFAYSGVLVHKCHDYLVYKSTGEGNYLELDTLRSFFCTQTSRPLTTPASTTPTTPAAPLTPPPQPHNACANNPCGSHGTCYNVGSSYECICQSGFTGRHCETDIDDCDPSPCLYGGTCTDRPNAYTCTCKEGFTGTNCETNINDCTSHPCQNGGQCVDGINGYYCFCGLGYSGPTCQTNDDNCADSDLCQNGGTCRDGVNTYTCDCASGFEGKNCENKISPCRSGPCRNGATCETSQNTYTCNCAPGYSGTNCETKFTHCDSQPCKNGGKCTSEETTYTCTCLPGWSGQDCDNDENIQKYVDDIDGLVNDDETFSMNELYDKVDDALDKFSDAASDDNDDSLSDKVGEKVEKSIKNYLGKKLENGFDKAKNKLSNCGGLNLGSAANNFKKSYNKCLQERKTKCQEEGKKEREEKGEDTDEETGNEEEEEEEREEEEEKEEEEESCSDKCPELQSIANGNFEGSNFDCGHGVTFSCEEGYELSGCSSDDCKITCERGGHWSSEPPTCIKKTCGGFITLSSSDPQTELSFTGTGAPSVDCTWVVITATQQDVNIDFPEGFTGISSRTTNCDNRYVEIGFGPEVVRFCQANRGERRSFSNMITVKLHSSLSSRIEFKLRVFILNDFYESASIKKSFLAKRTGGKRKRSPECEVHVNTFHWPGDPPILADPSTQQPIFPDKKDKTNLADIRSKSSKITLNSEFKALCSKSKFSHITKHPVPQLSLKCKNNDNFVGTYTIKSGTSRRPLVTDITDDFNFAQLSCEASPRTEVDKLMNQDHKLVWEFELDSINKFKINVIDKIKYDEPNQRPVYAVETVRGETLYIKSEGESTRPNFKVTPVITANQMDPDIYPKRCQKTIFQNINAALESKIDCCFDKYLVHGHLVPNADFFYKSWRDATFYMTNVAPQWQVINAGNWLRVENAVREYAKDKEKDMTVTTGIHGTLQIDGHDIKLPGNIPVPSHFWKVLYDPVNDAAVAFVIVNNPYADSLNHLPTGANKLCTAQCPLLSNARPTANKGLVMCCSPSDLKRNIDVPTTGTANLFVSPAMKTVLDKMD